jgi:hypothetical protein
VYLRVVIDGCKKSSVDSVLFCGTERYAGAKVTKLTYTVNKATQKKKHQGQEGLMKEKDV